MGKTAGDNSVSDGLSDETVAAAVYASVLGAANAEAWRDRLNRAGYDDVSELASRSAIGSGHASRQTAATVGWDGLKTQASDIDLTSGFSAEGGSNRPCSDRAPLRQGDLPQKSIGSRAKSWLLA